jgi:hypothetical protein
VRGIVRAMSKLRLGELTLVVIGRHEQQEHTRPAARLLAREIRVGDDRAPYPLQHRLEPHDLFERAGHQSAVGHERGALLEVLPQPVEPAGEDLRKRLGATDEQLLLRGPALGRHPRLAGRTTRRGVHETHEPVVILDGQPEQHARGRSSDGRTEIGDSIERTARHELVEQPAHMHPYVGFVRGRGAWQERRKHRATQSRVRGRIDRGEAAQRAWSVGRRLERVPHVVEAGSAHASYCSSRCARPPSRNAR